MTEYNVTVTDNLSVYQPGDPRTVTSSTLVDGLLASPIYRALFEHLLLDRLLAGDHSGWTLALTAIEDAILTLDADLDAREVLRHLLVGLLLKSSATSESTTGNTTLRMVTDTLLILTGSGPRQRVESRLVDGLETADLTSLFLAALLREGVLVGDDVSVESAINLITQLVVDKLLLGDGAQRGIGLLKADPVLIGSITTLLLEAELRDGLTLDSRKALTYSLAAYLDSLFLASGPASLEIGIIERSLMDRLLVRSEDRAALTRSIVDQLLLVSLTAARSVERRASDDLTLATASFQERIRLRSGSDDLELLDRSWMLLEQLRREGLGLDESVVQDVSQLVLRFITYLEMRAVDPWGVRMGVNDNFLLGVTFGAVSPAA